MCMDAVPAVTRGRNQLAKMAMGIIVAATRPSLLPYMIGRLFALGLLVDLLNSTVVYVATINRYFELKSPRGRKRYLVRWAV